jgi:ubiquitin-like 1-activating enzyme E1 B
MSTSTSTTNNDNNNNTNPLFGLQQTIGKDLLDKIQSCKILVVGAGGIGCELLKDLSLSGFRSVDVIDLDTIDVSNLNRQLLFRSQHVGMAKCTVACQVAADMVPALSTSESDHPTTTTTTTTTPVVRYQAHHGNVCDSAKFNVAFVQGFDLVLNALDNVEARRRVNRLCLAANVPLVEAGTTGYLGQVTVIHKASQVACYECVTQETQKVYPICTIRSTPSMPVHTIVWAKELYKLLCHSKVEDSMLYEDPQVGGSGKDGDDEEEDNNEPSTYMKYVDQVRALLKEKSTDDALNTAISDLLKALYVTEIQKQLDMGRYKAAKKTPSPLELDIIVGTPEESKSKSNENGASSSSSTKSTDIWSLQECVAECRQCLLNAANHNHNNRRKKEGEQGVVVLEEFEKDDDLSMRFVTATSNLRSHVFGIEPLQSLYSAKGIAGNIIPAIATTNAICAGLQILQAFRILKAQLLLQQKKEKNNNGVDDEELQLKDTCCYINCIRNKTRNGLYLTASKLEDPNPNCFVCRNATIPLTLNVNEWTLEDFLQKIVKGRLGFEAPTIELDGDFIWEEGEGADATEFAPNLPKILSQLPCGGIQHGTILELDDATQNLTIQVSVTHQDVWEGDEVEDHPFLVGAAPPKPQAQPQPQLDEAAPTVAAPLAAEDSSKPAAAAVVDDDDDVVLVVEDDEEENGDQKPAAKRSADVADNGEPAAKKAKVDHDDNDVIEIE